MTHPTEPLAYSIRDASRVSSLGRTRIYELINEKRLRTIKLGRRTLITAESLKALLSPPG